MLLKYKDQYGDWVPISADVSHITIKKRVNAQWFPDVVIYLLGSQKINAIKEYRVQTGAALREAKEAVDQVEREINKLRSIYQQDVEVVVNLEDLV